MHLWWMLAAGCGEAPEQRPAAGPVGAHGGVARVVAVGCAGSPFPSVQAAIDAAWPGDVVEVCPGTYRERLELSGKVLTLRSSDGPEATVIDGEGGVTMKIRDSSDVVLQGLTLRGGSSSGTGGNVSCRSSRFELRESVVEEGRARRGGGVGAVGCTGLLDRNRILGNQSDERGGGLYASPGLELTRNDFERNVATSEGGGAYLKDGDVLVRANSFYANSSVDDGGGLMIFRGAPWVDGNWFQQNVSGEEGGGLRLKSASGDVTDNALLANEASWRGGGAKISHDEVQMSGNRYESNHSDGKAGALLLFESASLLREEVFVGNTADHGGAVAILEGWGSVTLEDCLFDGNVASERGGHLFVDLLGFRTRLRRVTMRGGVAEEGGAVFATSESALEEFDPYDPAWVWSFTGVQLENTLLEDNVATVAGGAMVAEAAVGWVHNALFHGNQAPVGAGLQVRSGQPDFAVLNTIFASQAGSAAVQLDLGAPPDVRYSDFHDNDQDFGGMPDRTGGFGNRTSDPRFVDEAAGDYRLGAGSALVDRGDPQLLDPDGSRSDIGLYGGPSAAVP